MAKKRIFAAILAAVMAISCCACGEDNDDDDDDDKPKKDKTSSSQSADKSSKDDKDSKDEGNDDSKDEKPADSTPDDKPTDSKPAESKPDEGGASSGDVSALMGDWHVVKFGDMTVEEYAAASVGALGIPTEVGVAILTVNVTFTDNKMTLTTYEGSESTDVSYEVKGGKIYINSGDSDDNVIATISGNKVVLEPQEQDSSNEYSSLTLEKGAAKIMSEDEIEALLSQYMGDDDDDDDWNWDDDDDWDW